IAQRELRLVRLNEDDCRRQLDDFVAQLPSTGPTCERAGIVLVAGAEELLPSAWVSLNLLRRIVRSKLPIQLWHLGEPPIGRRRHRRPPALPPRARARAVAGRALRLLGPAPAPGGRLRAGVAQAGPRLRLAAQAAAAQRRPARALRPRRPARLPAPRAVLPRG